MHPVISDNLNPHRSAKWLGSAGQACVSAMSGGVDSSVATALAVADGLNVVGITMRLWSPGPGPLSEKVRQCCGPTAYEDARSAAEAAGISHYIVNFENAFSNAVVDYFCREYRAGRTPNPCVACNNLVKFGALLDFARALGAVTMVTGHYARVEHNGVGTRLLRADDRAKDQSYMLAGLRPAQLASLVMPLGTYTKEQTRQVAREWGLTMADKPDSVNLCFVDGDYRSFIVERFPDSVAPGPVMTLDGKIVGQHDGLLGFTVGQRRGLPSNLRDGPWYVVRTDIAANAVIVGQRDALGKRNASCSAANIVRPDMFEREPVHGLAVTRYRSRGIPALVRRIAGRSLWVEFEETVPMLAPGQLLALYDDDDREVLASGVIEP